MLQITGVVRHLLIINVLMYFGTMFLGEPQGELSYALINLQETDFALWGRLRLAIFYPNSPYFQPYQLISHMFMHGSIMHLFFNMFALFMFGPPIEAMWGPRRFLFYYLFAGFGALGLNFMVQYLQMEYLGYSPYYGNVPMLGASGAVFGLLLAYGMLFPNNIVQLIFPPIPMKAKYFVLIYAGLELFLGVSGFNTGIAHFAHLGGALFGFLLIMYWRKFGTNL